MQNHPAADQRQQNFCPIRDFLHRHPRFCRRGQYPRTAHRLSARQALRAALDGWNREQDAQAAGELLFAAANAMRLAGVDAEEALTFASKRYCAELLAQKEQSGTQVE